MAGSSVCRWWLWCGVRKKLVQGQTLNVGIRRAGRDFRSKRMSDRAVLGGAALFIEAAVATSGRNQQELQLWHPDFTVFRLSVVPPWREAAPNQRQSLGRYKWVASRWA